MVREDARRSPDGEWPGRDPLEVDDDDSPDPSDPDDGEEAIVVDPMTFCQPETSPVESHVQEEAVKRGRKRRRKADHSELQWTHPAELKRLLLGAVAAEMSVTVTRCPGGGSRVLTGLDCNEAGFDSVERHSFVRMEFPESSRPLRQHGDMDLFEPPEEDEADEEDLVEDIGSDRAAGQEEDVDGVARSSSRPKKWEAKDGVFVDAESGLTRYKCRNNCGTSLASSKGRRKHERRHCPLGSEDSSVVLLQK